MAKIHGVGNWNPPSQYGKPSWQRSRFSKTESADHLKPFHKCHPLVNLPAEEGGHAQLRHRIIYSFRLINGNASCDLRNKKKDGEKPGEDPGCRWLPGRVDRLGEVFFW